MRELRLVLLGLAAVIALLLGAGFLLRAFSHPAKHPSAVASTAPAEPQLAAPGIAAPDRMASLSGSVAPAGARAAIERAIADAPAYARYFDRLRLLFPSDYALIMNDLADSLKGGDIDVDKVAAQADATLRRDHGKLQAQSSDAALAQVFSTDVEAMKALQSRDPHLCVSYLFNATGPGFLGFAADHRDLVSNIAVAGLDAMNSGRMDHVQRTLPSSGDFADFERALVGHGLSRPEIEVLLDGKVAEPPIADDAMCKAGIAYLQTMGELPPDERARFYSLAVGLRS